MEFRLFLFLCFGLPLCLDYAKTKLIQYRSSRQSQENRGQTKTPGPDLLIARKVTSLGSCYSSQKKSQSNHCSFSHATATDHILVLVHSTMTATYELMLASFF